MKKVTPVWRYTNALLITERLRLKLVDYMEKRGGRVPINIIQILDDSDHGHAPVMGFSFTDPFPPHNSIHFINVQEVTCGAVILAASSSVKNPNTNKQIRFIISVDDNALTLPESEFQSLLKAAPDFSKANPSTMQVSHEINKDHR